MALGASCVPGPLAPGNPALRICSGPERCDVRTALAANDDCSRGVVCSRTSFACPATGSFVVMSAAFMAGGSDTCRITVGMR